MKFFFLNLTISYYCNNWWKYKYAYFKLGMCCILHVSDTLELKIKMWEGVMWYIYLLFFKNQRSWSTSTTEQRRTWRWFTENKIKVSIES